jgi:hypothetical protein
MHMCRTLFDVVFHVNAVHNTYISRNEVGAKASLETAG